MPRSVIRVVSAVLAVLAVLLLAACASAPAAPASAPAAPQAAAPTAASAAAPAQSGAAKTTFPTEPVTLNVWSGQPEMQAFYEQACAAYQKLHPNVTCNILAMPVRELEQKLAATLPADTAADVIDASPYAMVKYLDAGLIPEAPANVVEFMTKPGRFAPALVEDNKRPDGKYYGLNFFQGRHGLYWNTDMFKEAGLTAAPKTMDELVEAARKLAKTEGGKLARAGVSLRKTGGGSGVTEKFWMYLYPNGGSIIEKTPSGKWHSNYNNEAGRKTLQMYVDLLHKYKADSFELKSDTEGFELQQHAMYVRETAPIQDIAKKAPNLKYDTAPLPKGVRWGDLATGVNLWVTRTAKNPQVGWDFALFLNSDEMLRLLLDTAGWLPQRQDADLKASLAKSPQYQAFLFNDPNYTIYTYPTLAEYDEIQTKLAERLTKAFLDGSLVDNPAGIDKFLQEAAQETDDILKRNNHYGTN